jgi:DNA polymerase
MKEFESFLNAYVNNKELYKLYCDMQDCEKCKLCELSINNLRQGIFAGKLPGYGNINSKIVFVAQQPAYTRKGFKIFGVATDKNRNDLCFKQGLDAVGWKREDVFVTNVIKCSSENNEPVNDNIVEVCRDNWLKKELTILKPRFVVAVGKMAEEALGAIRGRIRWARMFPDDVHYFNVTAIRHPAYVLRGGMTMLEYQEEFAKLKSLIDNEYSHNAKV